MLRKFIAPISFIVLIVLGVAACSHSNTATEDSDRPAESPLNPRPEIVGVGLHSNTNSGCVSTKGGQLWCWGFYISSNIASPKNLPVDNVVEATLNSSGAGCVRTENNELLCWEERGEPDASFTNPQMLPVENVAEIAKNSGYRNGCALTNSDELWCWGSDNNYQRLQPQKFHLNNIVKLAGGSRLGEGCAFSSDQRLWCWSFGDVNFTNPRMLSISNVDKISLFSKFLSGCVLNSDRELWCWNARDDSDIYLEGRFPQIQKFPIDDITNIAEGTRMGYGCVHNVKGDLWCWGEDNNNPSRGRFDNPKKAPISNVVELSEISFYTSTSTCARTSDGEPWCWGDRYALEYEKYYVVGEKVCGSDAANQSYPSYPTTTDPLTGEGCYTPRNYVGGANIFVELQKLPINDDVIRVAGRCALESDDELWCWDNLFFEPPGKLSLPRLS